MAGFPGLEGIDLAQVMRMLQSTGPVNWEIAAQVARVVALEGGEARAVEPGAAEQLSELAHAAQALVVAETGLGENLAAPVRTVTRTEWVDLHLETLRPVLEALAQTLGDALNEQLAEEGGPGAFGDAAPGSMPGCRRRPARRVRRPVPDARTDAARCAGRFDGGLPRAARTRSLRHPAADVGRADAVLRRREPRHLRRRVVAPARRPPLLRRAPRGRARRAALRARGCASGWSSSPPSTCRRTNSTPTCSRRSFGDLDPMNPESLAGARGASRGAPRRDAVGPPARGARPAAACSRSVLEGYADDVLGRIGRPLIPSYDQIHEAIQRHRIERGEAERFIEGFIGLKLDRDDYERARRSAAASSNGPATRASTGSGRVRR